MLSSNHTNATVKGLQLPSTFYYVLLSLGIGIISVSALTISVLCKCNKLMFQVKFTSINLTVSNLLFGLTIISDPTYYLVHGSSCFAVLRPIIFCFTAYYLFLTIIGVDRAMSLKLAMTYTFWTKRRNAFIATASIYAIAFLQNVPIIIETNGKFNCEGHPREYFASQGMMIFSITLLILLVIQVASFGYIGISTLKRFKKDQNRSREHSINAQKAYKCFLKVTMKSFHLCVMSAVFIGPFIVAKFIQAFTSYKGDDIMNVIFASLVLMNVHQFVSPVFILLTYKECRYRFLIIFYHFNSEKKAKLETEYKQHYATFNIALKAEEMAF